MRLAKQVPGLLIFRWDAPLFFANADTFRARIIELVDGAKIPPRCSTSSTRSWRRAAPSSPSLSSRIRCGIGWSATACTSASGATSSSHDRRGGEDLPRSPRGDAVGRLGRVRRGMTAAGLEDPAHLVRNAHEREDAHAALTAWARDGVDAEGAEQLRPGAVPAACSWAWRASPCRSAGRRTSRREARDRRRGPDRCASCSWYFPCGGECLIDGRGRLTSATFVSPFFSWAMLFQLPLKWSPVRPVAGLTGSWTPLEPHGSVTTFGATLGMAWQAW